MSILVRLSRIVPLAIILAVLAVVIYLAVTYLRTPVRAKEVLIRVFTWLSTILIAFFGIVSLYALFEHNEPVLDLSVGFMVVGALALAITLLCRYLFHKRHPHYKSKPMKSHTTTRWRKAARAVRNAKKAADRAKKEK